MYNMLVAGLLPVFTNEGFGDPGFAFALVWLARMEYPLEYRAAIWDELSQVRPTLFLATFRGMPTANAEG